MNSHPNLLDSQQSVVLIVDIQTRLLQAMPELDAAMVKANVKKLVQAAKILQVPVLVTEQYPQGLGSTESDISQNLPETARIFNKTGFSCCSAAGFMQVLSDSGRQQVLIVGQETHICVLQTALALLQLGFQVYVMQDAVCSRFNETKQNAMQRLLHQGVTLVCLESVLFEWLQDASHADFRTISSLIR